MRVHRGANHGMTEEEYNRELARKPNRYPGNLDLLDPKDGVRPSQLSAEELFERVDEQGLWRCRMDRGARSLGRSGADVRQRPGAIDLDYVRDRAAEILEGGKAALQPAQGQIRVSMMLRSELMGIIANGENSGIEFKRDDVRPEQLAKEIVVLANRKFKIQPLKV
uniref:Uncharacterized protein n=1 Tax=Candidatus Kentrum eta TaxID=2126337 RepID=A0A450U9P3_9GAMM|nr:MAG: hypothetical protein BECKH772A_GA0070896_1001034 [Candidatus Kentron sp. H]VFJ90798.1 MAG: hypothetical protein BECKH772B_GA0070898_1001134 [Candidatus Kentron sp. H]VFJ96928.1 MAG: hypothetical protein BECKH772C_GA0070978_1000934 [Candidatus Kentron sp. H]